MESHQIIHLIFCIAEWHTLVLLKYLQGHSNMIECHILKVEFRTVLTTNKAYFEKKYSNFRSDLFIVQN